MAIELGTAYISILPSTNKIAPKIKESQRETESSYKEHGEKTGRSFAASFKAGAGRLLKGGAIAGIAGASLLAGAGLRTAAELEQTKLGFETMLGSAGAAQKMMDSIKATAAKTPFDLPGLTQSAQKLLAFGFTAKDVIPTLTTLGDAAAGTGKGAEGLNQVITAIGQIQAKGKVQGDELLQLTEAGIPALKILANQYGVTAEQMQESISKGAVKANEAIPMLLDGIKNGSKGLAGETTKFGGLMERQADSLTGSWSNLSDTVLVGLADAFTPFLPLLSGGLQGLTGALEPAMAGLAAGAERLAPALSSAVSGLTKGGGMGKAVGGLVSAWQTVGTAIIPVVTDFGRRLVGILGPGITQIVNLWNTQFLPALQKFLPYVTPIAAFLLKVFGDAVLGAISGVIQTVKGLIAFISGAMDIISGILSGDWSRVWEGVKSIITGAVSAIIGIFRVWWNMGIINIFKKGALSLLKMWRGGWKAIQAVPGKLLAAVGRVVKGAFKAILGLFKGAVKGYIGIWRGLWRLFKSLTTGGWAAVRSVIARAIVAVRGVISKGVLAIRNVWNAAWSAIKNTASSAWDLITRGIRTAMDAARSAFSKGVDGIRTIWAGIRDAARAPVEFVVNTVWNNGLRRVINAIPGAPDAPFIGFAQGGYTGPGAKYAPAGIVHADEFVIRSEARRQFERDFPGALAYLNRYGTLPGLAGGGILGGLKSLGSKVISGAKGKAKKWLDVISAVKDIISGLSLSGISGPWGDLIRPAARSLGNAAIAWANRLIPDWGPIPNNPIPQIFDNGGVLEPGALAFNASRKPEAVFNHRQFQAFADRLDGGRPRRVELVVGDKRFDAFMRDVAGDVYHGEAAYAGSVRRMNTRLGG